MTGRIGQCIELLIVVPGVDSADRPLIIISIDTLATANTMVEQHDLRRFSGAQRSGNRFRARHGKISRANAQCVGNRKVAQVSGAQFDVTVLVYFVDANPVLFAASGGETGAQAKRQ